MLSGDAFLQFLDNGSCNLLKIQGYLRVKIKKRAVLSNGPSGRTAIPVYLFDCAHLGAKR